MTPFVKDAQCISAALIIWQVPTNNDLDALLEGPGRTLSHEIVLYFINLLKCQGPFRSLILNKYWKCLFHLEKQLSILCIKCSFQWHRRWNFVDHVPTYNAQQTTRRWISGSQAISGLIWPWMGMADGDWQVQMWVRMFIIRDLDQRACFCAAQQRSPSCVERMTQRRNQPSGLALHYCVCH